MAVSVAASDPITKLGVVCILGRDSRLRVLDDEEASTARVVVVAEESVSDRVFDCLRETRKESASAIPPRCVIVTGEFRMDILLPAIECGISAVLPRAATSEEDLVRTVLMVNEGAAYLPPRLQGTLLAHIEQLRREVLDPQGLTLTGVSTRECDVLRLLADGYRTEEIADKLAYSESTVKNVLYTLMKRHNLNTRAQAVAFAVRSGII